MIACRNQSEVEYIIITVGVEQRNYIWEVRENVVENKFRRTLMECSCVVLCDDEIIQLWPGGECEIFWDFHPCLGVRGQMFILGVFR